MNHWGPVCVAQPRQELNRNLKRPIPFLTLAVSDISESKRDFIVAHHGDCRPLARKRGQAISDSKSIYISHHFRISRYDMI